MMFVCRRPRCMIRWGRAPGCQSGWGRAPAPLMVFCRRDWLGARPRLPLMGWGRASRSVNACVETPLHDCWGAPPAARVVGGAPPAPLMVFVCRRPRCKIGWGRAPGCEIGWGRAPGCQSGWGRASRSVNGVRVSTACAAMIRWGRAPPAPGCQSGWGRASRSVNGVRVSTTPLHDSLGARPRLPRASGCSCVEGLRCMIGWGRAPGCQSGWGRASRSVNGVRVSTTPLHDSLGARPRLPEWLGARLPLR